MKTYEIHISGRVQGVGFRPFVFNLAKEFGLKGYVSNDESGVVILIQGNCHDEFFNAIHDQKPVSSEIMHSEIKEVLSHEIFESFFIKPTAEDIVVDIPLTPDFATCKQCEKELFDEKNRRYFYPFTTCTQCGPRYSITKKFPFERENTAIGTLTMCPDCHHEYVTPEDVRFHSQTNSCPECGIEIWIKYNNGDTIKGNNKEIFEKLSEELHQGKIVACKNTAGYLLLCDATNPDAVSELRKRKRRPTKPFAVLFPDIENIRRHLKITDLQEEQFTAPESPIVVCEIQHAGELASKEISPNMNTMGAMFPYSGTLKLISKTFGKALIATSGNYHGSPICSTTGEAEENLAHIADVFLHNTLDVQHPQDDSVIRFSAKHLQKIIYRRSRGFAPNYFFAEELAMLNRQKEKIFCLGGDLKNSIAIVPNNHVYISEYIGDVGNFETFRRYEKTAESYCSIFDFEPTKIIKDLHPGYLNQEIITRFANTEIFSVQHHKAHFAAILGERKLWDKAKVLGIIWDGTGYGDQNNIWGGEFFGYQDRHMKRIAHFEEFAWILGDKMAKNPSISALSVSQNHPGLKSFFTENEWKLYTRLIEENNVQTSSVGRLFDAVAFILGYHNSVFFEGEASMWLEKTAHQAYQKNVEPKDYLGQLPLVSTIPVYDLFMEILNEKEKGIAPEEIALHFHFTLIKAIEKIAGKYFSGTEKEERQLAFSGGVWQNALLIDLAIDFLGSEYELNFHEKLSPNDENLSFGQLNYYLNIKD